MTQQESFNKLPSCKVLAVDLEGTLIQDTKDPIPRPGLFEFLNTCYDLFFRIVLFTAVTEPVFRDIAADLVKTKKAPPWFQHIEYVDWERPHKDLNFISGVSPEEVLLIDDYEGYIHPDQRQQWIKIDSFFENPDDQELKLLTAEFTRRMTQGPERQKITSPSP